MRQAEGAGQVQEGTLFRGEAESVSRRDEGGQVQWHPGAVAVDGFSYERVAIEWHFQKSMVSPLTGATLQSSALVPNVAPKQMIREHEATVQN